MHRARALRLPWGSISELGRLRLIRKEYVYNSGIPPVRNRHRSINPTYRNASYAVVYDVTSRTSFNAVHEWMRTIAERADCPDMATFLIANKIDLLATQQPAVSGEEGRMIAKQYNVPFFETSALSGAGVEGAFNEIISASVAASEKQAQRSCTSGPFASISLESYPCEEGKKARCC